MKIGICILNYNSGAQVLTCVQSIIDTIGNLRHTILVVDNHSWDDSMAQLRATFRNVDILENSSNIGYARGNNMGVFALIERGCDYVLCANPDVTMTCNTISRMTESMVNNPSAGCVGGPSLAPDGSISSGCRTKPSFLNKLFLYSLLWRPFLAHVLPMERERSHESIGSDERVYAIKGACILLRASAFQQVEGFDPETFLYEEEFILAEKLYRSGWSVIYSREALYDHITAQSTKLIPLRQILYFMDSEQHLIRSYYKWNAMARYFILACRSAEWLLYAMYWILVGRLRNRPIISPSASPPSHVTTSGS